MSTDNQVKIDSLKAGMKKADTLIRSLNVVIDQAEKEKWDAETNWAKLHEELSPVSYTHLTLPTNREV